MRFRALYISARLFWRAREMLVKQPQGFFLGVSRMYDRRRATSPVPRIDTRPPWPGVYHLDAWNRTIGSYECVTVREILGSVILGIMPLEYNKWRDDMFLSCHIKWCQSTMVLTLVAKIGNTFIPPRMGRAHNKGQLQDCFSIESGDYV